MTKKHPGGPAHTLFKPGNPGGGRPKGLLTQSEISALIGKFWRMNREELQSIVSNPKSTMGEIMVASVMARAAKDGDYSRLEGLLTRGVGKVKEVSEVTHNYDDELRKVDREKIVALLKEA